VKESAVFFIARDAILALSALRGIAADRDRAKETQDRGSL